MTSYVESLPVADALADVLLDLAVPHEDIGALLALRRRMTADPELRDLLEAAVGALIADMGEAGGR
ncbi:acyltransferase domain-containing protein, partial [Streptomyces sp. AcH 505]